jgi:hypothetical protein
VAPPLTILGVIAQYLPADFYTTAITVNPLVQKPAEANKAAKTVWQALQVCPAIACS